MKNTAQMKSYLPLFFGFAFIVLLIVAGCGSNATGDAGTAQGSAPASTASTPQAGSVAAGSATLIADGQAVFAANGCANCHAVGGQGGSKAPHLTRVGADAEHTPEWLIAHVKNPQVHKPDSRMPGFEGKINDKDLEALGAYLASLK
jgi:mono/diheme cytochrome c family protein